MNALPLTGTLTTITPTAQISRETHGWRAKCLQRLVRMDLPVPASYALSTDAVREIAQGRELNRDRLSEVTAGGLMSVRPSALLHEWGGPGTVLNVGMTPQRYAALVSAIGQKRADRVYARFIGAYAVHVARLDPDMFESDDPARLLEAYADETDDAFPIDPAQQLSEVLRSMARAWEGPTARLLRQAKGAPADAPLGLVVQQMARSVGPGKTGSGTFQLIDGNTGHPGASGRFRGQPDDSTKVSIFTSDDADSARLEQEAPEAFSQLVGFAEAARIRLREEMQLEFVMTDGTLAIIDAVPASRSARATVRVAVELARDGIIPPEEAVQRVQPSALSDLLHHQVDRRDKRPVLARGIAASPGAAVGQLVFTATDAQASAARGDACILARRETAPGDVRGMHAAAGVLTERGGATSHAAVIARGLGVPCIVGASDVTIDARARTLRVGALTLSEGDVVTVDGSAGTLLQGASALLAPGLDDDFAQLLTWADGFARMEVRANAETPEDARVARRFEARGIGLCRTEHMFFDDDRLPAMREMIFADTPEDRRLALERILPMQREDFRALFRIMPGLPVTIRLFDPPLHEFLPSDREGLRELAESLDLPLSDVTRRVATLSEFNPMLGMRGVRLGIVIPEIYEMQARAIFEATVAEAAAGDAVVPEIMIPLVSAMREVELVKTRIDAVAAAVRTESRARFAYHLGVMVETPRAALRAGDIAHHAKFLSFGTNDLTQMTYGLSRDDAGRFMGDYVKQGVYDDDPFHVLDTEGVGELLRLGVARARAVNPDIRISLCGEHGGNAESIAFCEEAGFDDVSCSPFRVPVARLAAARAALACRARGVRPVDDKSEFGR